MSNTESTWGTPAPKPTIKQAFKRFFALPAYILNINNLKGADKVKDVFNTNARLYHAIQFSRSKANHGKLDVTIKNSDLMQMASLDDRSFTRARKALVEAGLVTATPVDTRKEIYRYELTNPLHTDDEQDDQPIDELEAIVVPIPGEVTMAILSPNVQVGPLASPAPIPTPAIPEPIEAAQPVIQVETKREFIPGAGWMEVLPMPQVTKPTIAPPPPTPAQLERRRQRQLAKVVNG